MRKPLLVVCAATSAMVLGGVLVATSAGAQETPDVPGVPGFSMPDLSSLFGDVSGGADLDADNSPVSDGDAGSSDFSDVSDPGSSDVSDPWDISDSSSRADGPHAAHAPQKPAVRPAPQRPSQDDEPVQARPARPAQDVPGFAQRPATTGLITAAREYVTAGDISSSPSAPVQQQVLALVNQNRRRGGCDELTLDRRLIDAANEHAADMARRDYFAHESPNGAGAGDRVRDAGYRWSRYGENIARGADSAYEVVDGWMHSPEHRENILDCRLHQMGVGLALSGDDTPYWVQDFATPMN
jgi:uncharacterized protein YkwD